MVLYLMTFRAQSVCVGRVNERDSHTHTVLSVYPRITNQYTLLLLFQKTEEASIIRAVKYLNRFRKKIELAFEKAKRKKTKSFASAKRKK